MTIQNSLDRHRLLIVNRGEIACRIAQTARRLGYHIVCIYTLADVSSMHIEYADVSACVSSYTDIGEIINVIGQYEVQYVIPGYGFLSENENFAAAVSEAGAKFVGPEAKHIAAFGIKDRARDIAAKNGVPICPGSGLLLSEQEAVRAAASIGYPVMLKATAGGGGMGLQICNSDEEVRTSFVSVVSRGQTLFSNPGVFLERYYAVSRHIEVQIFGDGLGDCVVFGERECSIQRRHQKVIEESPSPFVEARPELRQKLYEASQLLGQAINYSSAGTVEFLVDDMTGDFFFLEMNTRLQVEHGITELRFDIDLVELMLQLASGPLDLTPFKSIQPRGYAIEARVYAENPLRNHLPSPGVLQQVEFADDDGLRVDTWVRTGTNVSLSYDPLLAKLMGSSLSREGAIETLLRALRHSKIQGVVTNLHYLITILESQAFGQGKTTTNFLDKFQYIPNVLEVISPGSYTTIQDLPARMGVGFGIPTSGPMDALHARLANIIAGNDPGVELLEITLSGPTIKFHKEAIFTLTGAPVDAKCDDACIPMWTRNHIKAGSMLEVGLVSKGSRAYLAIKGGLPGVPLYLGSKSTSPVIEIGGLQGRPLVKGDLLELPDCGKYDPFTLPTGLIPAWDSNVVYCLSGPHDSPDIVTVSDLQTIFNSEWTVTHQTTRVGIRLDGPQLQWARSTGGEGGSHPSNYIDYPYSAGALSWTGDSSVIFMPDCPSIGGFISTGVIPSAELPKIAQMRPGHKFRFAMISIDTAIDMRVRQDEFLHAVTLLARGKHVTVRPLRQDLSVESLLPIVSTAILYSSSDFTIRQAGDSYILIEFPQSISLNTRFRIQALTECIETAKIEGVRLSTPMPCSTFIFRLTHRNADSPSFIGILIEYDLYQIKQDVLLRKVLEASNSQSSANTVSRKLKSRRVKLPFVFDDKVNRACVERYIATQRPYASYLPDPIEFIARSNGLKSREEVLYKTLMTDFLVVGIGFFGGTPFCLPLDPRARLIVPKFNPPRNSSPAGGVGIGGVFFTCDPIVSSCL